MVQRCRNIKNMNKVWENLMKYASEDKNQEKIITEAFNQMLDDLLGDDFFGTEGQCDPRGDHRNDW